MSGAAEPRERRTLLCIVVGSARSYGVGQVWDDLLRGFSARGWNVVIAVLESEQAHTWRSAYPDLAIATAPRSAKLVQAAPGRWSRLVSMILRVRGQLAHVGWLTRLAREVRASTLVVQSPPETLLAALVGRRVGARSLWLVPNAVGTDIPFGLNRLAYRGVLTFGRVAAVANSRFTDSTLGPGGFERHVVHLGVDDRFYRPGGDPALVRQALGIPEDAPVIGLFARMTPSKGQDRLIEALAESGTPFHLLFCGGPIDGDYADRLRDSARRLGVADRVHLAGPQTDLRPYYAAADIIANMRVDPEPFGLTIIEAMASGRPVFAHASGGPSETVIDGETGWLLPDVEVSTIADGLRRAVDSTSRWPELGRIGANHAKRHFRKDRFLDQVEELARRNHTDGNGRCQN